MRHDFGSDAVVCWRCQCNMAWKSRHSGRFVHGESSLSAYETTYEVCGCVRQIIALASYGHDGINRKCWILLHWFYWFVDDRRPLWVLVRATPAHVLMININDAGTCGTKLTAESIKMSLCESTMRSLSISVALGLWHRRQLRVRFDFLLLSQSLCLFKFHCDLETTSEDVDTRRS